MAYLQPFFVAILSLALGAHYSGLWSIPQTISSTHSSPAEKDESDRFTCLPFLPKLFIETPPSTDHPLLRHASDQLRDYLTKRFTKGDIDSLSIGVVTSGGVIFEENFGVMRGNESGSSPRTHRHSMYRIASTAKLFPVLEGLILSEKGVLSWDDPVEKYLPQFTPRLDGFSPPHPAPNASSPPPLITLHQLGTHLSGIGRDWPSGTVADWPKSLKGGGPPPTNGLPFPSNDALLKAIADTRLVSPPSSYPSYSNAAPGVLGMALVAANKAFYGSSDGNQPETYAELVQRDIFDPLHLNGSHFLATEANKHLIVVPSLGPEVADQDFLDAMNPSAGQFSSLADMLTFTTSLLNPATSLISQSTMGFWLQPAHVFEEDDWTEVGLMWEIIKARDSNGRLRKIYWKLGKMGGVHAAAAIHPGTTYGVVVLMAGHYADAAKLAYDTFEIMQPGIDGALADLAVAFYAGRWSSKDGQSRAKVSVEKGTIYLEELWLSGADVLRLFYARGRLALRGTGRRDELRIDTGFPGDYNGAKHMGCIPYWNAQDLWGLNHGFPINLLYFTGTEEARVMHVPSADTVLERV